MTQHKLLTIALASALSALTLSACSRSADQSATIATDAQGASLSTPDQSSVAGSIDAAPAPAPVETAPAAPAVSYADVTNVKPITAKTPIYGTVIANTAITKETTAPKEVCQDVTVQEKLPEKDGNVGGTIVGGLVGGLLGNQVGKGKGKTLATVGGAVAGGFAGNAIDKRSDNGKVVTRVEQQCHTENATTSQVTGYTVSYRKADGSKGSQRMSSEAEIGSRLTLGQTSKVVGYDVTYQYEGKTSTVRMDSKPGERLQVVDGAVVTSSAAVNQG